MRSQSVDDMANGTEKIQARSDLFEPVQKEGRRGSRLRLARALGPDSPRRSA